MNFDVVISESAMDDIVRNANWWARHHSHDQALFWYESIVARIGELSESPEMNALAVENQSVSFELRALNFGLGSKPGYRILYTIVESTVEVLAVKAAEEDWLDSSRLDEIGP